MADNDDSSGWPAYDSLLPAEQAHMAYALSAILLAATFLETAINELYATAADSGPKVLADLQVRILRVEGLDARQTVSLASLWNSEAFSKSISVMPKYQLALLSTGKEPIHTGSQPYQDADLLIKLRNALVHFKPEWYQLNPPEIGKGLASKLAGKFRPFTEAGGSFFPSQCLGHGGAEWAVKSAVAFADEFHGRLGITPVYRQDGRILATRHPD